MEVTTAPVLYGVTSPISATAFLVPQLNTLASRSVEVHLVYGTDGNAPVVGLDSRLTQHQVRVRRNPSPLGDLRGLADMVRHLRRVRPGTVVLGTPKMSLLGMLAARLLRVPRRIHVLHGLRLEGATGLGRWVLTKLEQLTAACATEVLAVSESVRAEAVRLEILPEPKISVVGRGSAVGVDLGRFAVPSTDERAAARARLGLPGTAPVVGFVGRLAMDKGLPAMVDMWRLVQRECPDAWFVVVGPEEPDLDAKIQVETLRGLRNVKVVGAVAQPERVMAAMDVQVLLTKREGFGQVVLEAGACGVPTVGTRVSGLVDAVVDGVTGTLVPAGDVDAAAGAVVGYLRAPDLSRLHGRAARARVREYFEAERVTSSWAERILGAANEGDNR